MLRIGFTKRHIGLHRLAEFVVGFGVELGVARDLAMRLAMVVHAPEIIAVRHGRERAVERKNFQAMARQIEVANDLRPQQRNYVGADRELEAGKDFFGDGRAAEHMAALEHQNFLAGAREISGVDQAVVAAADHDYVVFSCHMVLQLLREIQMRKESMALSEQGCRLIRVAR